MRCSSTIIICTWLAKKHDARPKPFSSPLIWPPSQAVVDVAAAPSNAATATRPYPSPSAHVLASSLVTLRLTLISFFTAIPHHLSLLLASVPAAVLEKIPGSSMNVDSENHLVEPEVVSALKHSCDGHHLIEYADLPAAWHNNPYISTGYRFIPLHRYFALLQSIFTPHNEFLSIQTHLLPMLLWGLTFRAADPAEAVFTAAVLICLGSSVVWHTMSGCAHRGTMEFCARVDYVGIGWLISASIGTIVYYGYATHPHIAYPFLALCLAMAVLGSVLPFMAWFDHYENRLWRLAFFIALVFCAAAPIAGLAIVYDVRAMASFVAPILPTLASCGMGVIFYALHIPERFLTPGGEVGEEAGECWWRLTRNLARMDHPRHLAMARGARRYARGCRCLGRRIGIIRPPTHLPLALGVEAALLILLPRCVAHLPRADKPQMSLPCPWRSRLRFRFRFRHPPYPLLTSLSTFHPSYLFALPSSHLTIIPRSEPTQRGTPPHHPSASHSAHTVAI
ncbi:putative G-protein coupled receptor [Mycena venus]|uniref:Putative G-protein coupled receptor n=1 Tax=Mycena venus TaxID=2733690 RepID=A0A8H7CW01_9AGAR|nr:putative G-protein coupled receptor [Mycena venus]